MRTARFCVAPSCIIKSDNRDTDSQWLDLDQKPGGLAGPCATRPIIQGSFNADIELVSVAARGLNASLDHGTRVRFCKPIILHLLDRQMHRDCRDELHVAIYRQPMSARVRAPYPDEASVTRTQIQISLSSA